ncbi:hypothetical protein [Streptomyces sp. NPDC001933]|uniref:hypothetical protein n=1 Tax=Streptomyces sp. NPDC001933 TaxID=3364626 RepID=UPI003691D831
MRRDDRQGPAKSRNDAQSRPQVELRTGQGGTAGGEQTLTAACLGREPLHRL